jgi:hypothetical protein
MNFQPKTEREIADAKLWPKGDYDFEILDAWEKRSAAGNEMIELKLRLSNGNGLTRSLPDYLLSKRAGKLRHCAAACGLVDKYLTGLLSDDDFVGKRGRLRLGIEKDRTGNYPPKNVVIDYLT